MRAYRIAPGLKRRIRLSPQSTLRPRSPRSGNREGTGCCPPVTGSAACLPLPARNRCRQTTVALSRDLVRRQKRVATSRMAPGCRQGTCLLPDRPELRRKLRAWLVRKGRLYQLSAYAPHAVLVRGIVATWIFGKPVGSGSGGARARPRLAPASGGTSYTVSVSVNAVDAPSSLPSKICSASSH
jgi:hypothetical protein